MMDDQWEAPCQFCGFQKRPIKIIQGGHCTFVVQILDPATKGPLDLTDATAITTCFQNTIPPELALSLGSGVSVLSPANLGKVQIDVTAAQTALLRTVSLSTLELAISISGTDPVKTQIEKAYWVSQTKC